MSGKKPFNNLRFCSTSLSSDIKTDVATKIKAMGGVYYNSLMSDVTHLIVGDRNTEKYNFAVQSRHDIIFISAETIFKLHETWISGNDQEISLADLQLPVFEGLTICLSRINDTDSFTKDEIVQLVARNGGKTSDSLNMNCSCVLTTERSGRRFTKAVEWKIPIVHPKWILDSVRRNSSLNMKYYDLINMKESHIGRGSCDVWKQLEEFQRNNFKRPFSVTNQEETMPMKKPKRSTNIWNSIMETNVPTSVMPKKKDTTWGINDQPDSESDSDKNQYQYQEPLPDEQNTQKSEITSKLFVGLNFAIYGFDPAQTAILKKVIRSHTGEVSQLANYTLTHLIIPTTMNYRKLPHSVTKSIPKDAEVVTEWFLERSIFSNSVTFDKWGAPLNHLSFTKLSLKICISGFTGIELLHITKLIELTGCKFCETLTSDRDLLIINVSMIKSLEKNSPLLFQYKHKEIIQCKNNNNLSLSSTRNKITAAKKWEIPIVSVAYLWEIIESGKLPDLLDLHWCIFAPKNCAKPRNLLEYVKTLSGGTFETPKSNNVLESSSNPRYNEKEHSDAGLHGPEVRSNLKRNFPQSTEETVQRTNDTLPQLPSPRKNKRKVWGRLIGRATESLTTIEKKSVIEENVLQDFDDENHDHREPFSTQITYEHPDSIRQEK